MRYGTGHLVIEKATGKVFVLGRETELNHVSIPGGLRRVRAFLVNNISDGSQYVSDNGTIRMLEINAGTEPEFVLAPQDMRLTRHHVARYDVRILSQADSFQCFGVHDGVQYHAAFVGGECISQGSWIEADHVSAPIEVPFRLMRAFRLAIAQRTGAETTES